MLENFGYRQLMTYYRVRGFVSYVRGDPDDPGDWAFIRLDDGDPSPGGQAGQRWLLVHRNRKTRELAFYDCWTPRPVSLATLVRVAGRRSRAGPGMRAGVGRRRLDHPRRRSAPGRGTWRHVHSPNSFW